MKMANLRIIILILSDLSLMISKKNQHLVSNKFY